MKKRSRPKTPKPRYSFAGGQGGGAIEVVVDEHGKAFGFICDDGYGVATTSGSYRVDKFAWWIDGGPSGADEDYERARAALGRAAAEWVLR